MLDHRPHHRPHLTLVDTPMPAGAPAEAHLVIHSAINAGGSHVASALRWLRSLYARYDKAAAHPFTLQIADLHGHVVFACDDVGALVDVPLPAGTYQVKAQYGDVRRDYTLTLAQGRSFDLYLSLAKDSD